LLFAPTPDYALGYSHHLSDLVYFLARQLDQAAPGLPPPLLRELEQAIIVAFLSVNEHTLSRQLHQDTPHAALREVRRAEDYIEANWYRAITIEELAEVTQVSVRNLFRSFRKARGYSPMAFLRMLRLKKVKQMLDEGGLKTSVTGAALLCGFQNAGHFARQYREMFGELPSTTLARAQAVNGD
jgi:transcriptional regulator GlxA family with amidase domain